MVLECGMQNLRVMELLDEGHVERFGDPAHSPLELLASVEYRFDFGLAIRGGVGKGLTPGFGSTDFRAFVGASWAVFRPIDRDRDGIPDPDDACRREPEDLDGWEDADGCPDPNNDGDHLVDLEDQCPNEPEDLDQFEDFDGCADPDNDGDGLDDGEDTCPLEAEDPDLFQDGDGCPDPDNDGDGILDVDDSCPMNPETVDGWADDDGCPDPDNDDDGIPDVDDLCPDEAEERNGVKDEDGCPDDRLAVRTEGRIAILERILFATGSSRIERDSMTIVQTVATMLKESPDILQVRVEGHTDNKGKPDSNQRLSQRRAEAVVKKLIELGVEAARLEAVGYGDARPVDSNRTEEGRTNNRRIEFRILAQETQMPEVQQAPENPWGLQLEESPIGPAPVEAPKPPEPVELKPAENPW